MARLSELEAAQREPGPVGDAPMKGGATKHRFGECWSSVVTHQVQRPGP